MNDYIETRLEFEPCDEMITDVASAFLAEAGFESFVADATGLSAYINKSAGTGIDYEALFADFPFEVAMKVETKVIEGEDWNSEWEKNYFKPIVVGGQCVIHSTFHTDVPKCRYDIVIDPKMAFGTGHHATTSLMIERLLATDVVGKKVIDMGTGTGILAILAAMLGASKVTGIEIDPAARENADENVKLNGHGDVAILEGDASLLAGVDAADLLLANINRNIILADIDRYAAAVKDGGEVVLSGFYREDIDKIKDGAASAGLAFVDFTERDRWVSVKLEKLTNK